VNDVTFGWPRTIPYFQKVLLIMEPWMQQIGSSERERTELLVEVQIAHMIHNVSTTESNMSVAYRTMRDWKSAQYYGEQAIIHGKQLKDKDVRTNLAYTAYTSLGDLLQVTGKFTEAKNLMEEAYVYVSEVYNPEHPLVLKAGKLLILALNRTQCSEDFYNAERFARISYKSLTRAPLDPESYAAAQAASNLAIAPCNLIKANGPESADINEAEKLANDAVRIWNLSKVLLVMR
jgi:hypothetical protein